MLIDHVGIAVRSLDKAAALWENAFGYRRMTSPVVNSRQKVRVMFLEKPGSTTIKLIEPSEESSPISDFTSRGGGLHHLCFRCESVPAQIEVMKKQGFRLLAGPQPGEAFENENIAFMTGPGLNVELIDTDRRANRLAR